MERKLTAILCADVFGYSRLMGEDEEATLRTLSSHRKLIDSLIEQHRGRFVNSAGDSVLAEFASVVNAVQCAVEIQSTLKAENAPLPPERRMEFRIGVNLGDVMVDGEQIYGDGVNVAARLESLADPGGICISAIVHGQIKNRLILNYEDLGEQTVKNIAEPVQVYRVLTESDGAATVPKKTQRVARNYWRGGAFSLAGLAIIAAVIIVVQHLSLRPPSTTASIPPAQKPALPLPNIPSIAVLPFTNMSGDPQQEYFSDGITDDLITSLSRLPSILVIARNSTFTYKGKAVKEHQVGQELGVKYVLEGGVQKAGDQVRITAQLVDATTGTDLWSERYDRPMKDIFALQDEIVKRIVTTLNLQLGLWEKYGILARKHTTTWMPMTTSCAGPSTCFSSGTKESNAQARQMFEQAIYLDPKYADAYFALGLTYYLASLSQWSQGSDALDRAFQLEQQAIALDDSEAQAHAILGAAHLFRRQYELAVAEGKRAVALNPSNPFCNYWLAIVLVDSGKPLEAIASAEKAARLDPANRDYYLFVVGYAYTMTGRYAEAIPVLKKTVAYAPDFLFAHFALAVDYTEVGRKEDANAETTEILRISPQFSLGLFKQRNPYKDQSFMERWLADLRKTGLK
jgi:adenylate cyclase